MKRLSACALTLAALASQTGCSTMDPNTMASMQMATQILGAAAGIYQTAQTGRQAGSATRLNNAQADYYRAQSRMIQAQTPPTRVYR